MVRHTGELVICTGYPQPQPTMDEEEHKLNNITQAAVLDLEITIPIAQKRIKEGTLHLLLSDGTHITWTIPPAMLPTPPANSQPQTAKPKRGKPK